MKAAIAHSSVAHLADPRAFPALPVESYATKFYQY